MIYPEYLDTPKNGSEIDVARETEWILLPVDAATIIEDAGDVAGMAVDIRRFLQEP